MRSLRHAAISVLFPAVALVAPASPAHASVIVFNDRAAWEAAIGKPLNYFENFNSITTETPFDQQPVQLEDFSLQQIGPGSFRNFIDLPPFLYPDNNDSNNASMFVDGDGPTSVQMIFNWPAIAFGADFTATAGNEHVQVALSGAGNPTFNLPGQSDSDTNFFGFVTTDGETITQIQFVSPAADGNLGWGEGFSMDNVAGAMNDKPAATVPEPDTLLLASLLLGLAPLASPRPLLRTRPGRAQRRGC